MFWQVKHGAGEGKAGLDELKRQTLGSGKRHVDSRGVSMSARLRKQRGNLVIEEPVDPQYESAPVDDRDESSGSDDYLPLQNEIDDAMEDEVERLMVPVNKGPRGKFVRSSSSSQTRRSRESDDSWIVTGSVPGGPYDADVIPSFLGHVAYQIWNGQVRDIIKCHNRVSCFGLLRSWYDGMDAAAKTRPDRIGLSHLHYVRPLCSFSDGSQTRTHSTFPLER